MATLPKVAVEALKIAPVGHDKFKISKRRCRRRVGEDFSSNRSLREGDQIFG
jgi:hypothetical protein